MSDAVECHKKLLNKIQDYRKARGIAKLDILNKMLFASQHLEICFGNHKYLANFNRKYAILSITPLCIIFCTIHYFRQLIV